MPSNKKHHPRRRKPIPDEIETSITPARSASNLSAHIIPFSSASALSLPCEGKPDIFLTRLVCAAFALLFIFTGISAPVAIAFDKTVTIDVTGVLLLALLDVVCGWGIWLAVRAYTRAGGWFIVDHSGFRYGVGPQKGSERSAVETCVAWQEIVVASNSAWDVSTDFVTSKSVNKALQFWRRLPSGEIVQHRLPLNLLPWSIAPDSFRCIRFLNRRTILVALLQGLATRPDLRFDADVFVDTAIDPQTWQLMRRPRLEFNLGVITGTGAVVACLAAYVHFMVEKDWPFWSVWPALAGSFIIAILIFLLFIIIWNRRYPDLNGIITFEQENQAICPDV